MALEAPLRSSIGSINAFSPQAEISVTSPESTTLSHKFNPMYATPWSSNVSHPNLTLAQVYLVFYDHRLRTPTPELTPPGFPVPGHESDGKQRYRWPLARHINRDRDDRN